MVTKKPKGLGRGLEALLGPKVEEKVEQAQAAEAGLPSSLPLSELVPGVYQPRTRMDEGALYELAESIKAQGIMQPILVRRLTDGDNAGKYEIIAGERRFRASRLAGLDAVPVLVRDVPNEAAADSSGTSRTSTGTSAKPAKRDARKRRSPAMISYLPALSPPVRRRTKIGCMMPCALMLSASSYSAPSSMRVRGWYTPGTSSDNGRLLGNPASAA